MAQRSPQSPPIGIDPETQLQRYKRKSLNILEILRQRGHKEDVEDLVSTIESVIPIINRMLVQLKNFEKHEINACLVRLHNSLEAYEEAVVKLDRTGKLMRFLTSSRLRKKIDNLNSDLHKDIEYFVETIIKVEVKAETSASPVEPPQSRDYFLHSAVVAEPKPITISDNYSSYVHPSEEVNVPNTVAKDDWDRHFGVERQMAEWKKVVEFMFTQGLPQVNEEEQIIMKYVLDNSHTGYVSKTKYNEYLKGFGRGERGLQNLKEIFHQQWFYGYLSSKEAEILLNKQPAGTFLVRLSKSAAGNFAIAFVFEQQKIVHLLVTSQQPSGYQIIDQDTNSSRIFKDLGAILEFYSNILVRPFVSTIPLQSWFQGDVTGEESNEMLSGEAPGTFVIRFSSQPGCYAASYVDGERKVRHTLVEPAGEGGFKIHGEQSVHATMSNLIEFYNEVLIKPLTNVDQNSLAKIKELTEKNYDPQLTWKLKEDEVVETQPVEKLMKMESVHKELDSLLSDIETVIPSNPTPANANLGFSLTNSMNFTSPPTSPIVKKVEEEDKNAIAKLALNDKKYPTRWCYLYEDKLVLSAHTFSLWTTWIENMQEDFKMGGQMFRIVGPEKRIVVCATEKHEKQKFVEIVNKQIVKLLESKGYLRSEDGKRRYSSHRFSNGAYYEGEWENGVFDGHGTQLLSTGQKYTGDWVVGLKSGNGAMLEANGNKYDGQWKDNQKEGFGIYYYTGNQLLNRYEGPWKGDKKHGVHGTLFYLDRSVLVCEWHVDEPLYSEKVTILIYSNGDKYVGDCVANPAIQPFQVQRQGYGVLTFANGDRYAGSFIGDKRTGFAHLTSGGIEFKGEFYDGRIQGNGVLVMSDADHLLSGVFSGDVEAGIEVKSAVFKKGGFVNILKNESTDQMPHKPAIMRGDKWKPLLGSTKWSNFRKSDLAKSFDETLINPNTNSTSSDITQCIARILSCDSHLFGAMTIYYTKLLNNLYFKIKEHHFPSSARIVAADVHSFIGAMVTQLMGSYKILNTDEGAVECTNALIEIVFPQIYSTLIDSFCETYKNEDGMYCSKIEKLKSLPLENIMGILGLETRFWETDKEKSFQDAIHQLSQLGSCRSPTEKLSCMVSTSRKVEQYLQNIMGSAIGADQLLPCVCYVLLQSENPHFFSGLHFLEEFLPEAYQTGIEGYIVTQFQIAGRFLKDMNIQLHLDSLDKKPEVKEQVPQSPPKEEHDAIRPNIVSELDEIINLESQAQEEIQKNLASGEPPKVKSLIHLYEKTTGNPPN